MTFETCSVIRWKSVNFFHFWLWLLFHILCGFASRQLLQKNCFFSIDMNKNILSEHTPFRISSKGGCHNNCHQNHHHHRIIVNSKILIKVPHRRLAWDGWEGWGCRYNCHQHHNRHHHYPKYKILIKVPSQKAGLGWLGGLDGKGRGEADSAQDGRYMDLLIFCQLLDGSWSLIPWSSWVVMLMPSREMGSASLTGVNQWMAVMAEHMAQVCHNADDSDDGADGVNDDNYFINKVGSWYDCKWPMLNHSVTKPNLETVFETKMVSCRSPFS